MMDPSADMTSDIIIPKILFLNERYEFNSEALTALRDTFKGEHFAFAGHTDLMTRLDFEEFIRHCGGEHTHRVTKKTNYLIRGENLGDENKLFEQAVEKGITVISPQEFFQLLSDRKPAIDVEILLQPEFHHQISFDRESVRKYSLELSPNGKGKCVHCHNNIKKGMPRIRVCFRQPHDWVYHRCLPCLTEQILSNIIAEWDEYPDPMKAFVAAQPAEVIAFFRALNPSQAIQIGGQVDQSFVIEKLHQYAEEEMITFSGEKRPLTNITEGEANNVPMGKKAKKISIEGVHETLRKEIEIFLHHISADPIVNSTSHPCHNVNQTDDQIDDENTLPGSARQTNLVNSIVKSSIEDQQEEENETPQKKTHVNRSSRSGSRVK